MRLSWHGEACYFLGSSSSFVVFVFFLKHCPFKMSLDEFESNRDYLYWFQISWMFIGREKV